MRFLKLQTDIRHTLSVLSKFSKQTNWLEIFYIFDTYNFYALGVFLTKRLNLIDLFGSILLIMRTCIVWCIVLAAAAIADVAVYPAIEPYRSSQYATTIIQDETKYAAFVYEDQNQFTEKLAEMTNWNHFSIFSFSKTVTVEVSVLDGDVKACTIYPLNKKITPQICGNKISFMLNGPAKLWLAVQGKEEHPLFLFADRLEENIPSAADPNNIIIAAGATREEAIAKLSSNPSKPLVYFEPGIHRLGLQFPVKADTTYYVPGGAVVEATFFGDQISNTIFRGRGILTGRGFGSLGGSKNQTNTTLFFGRDNSCRQRIEGITIIDPPYFCIIAGSESIIRNVKMFGWWYSTDGITAGDNSVIEDCFFKVNDDAVKLYSQRMQVRDCVIWQEINGAPFQFGGSDQKSSGGRINNIDLICSQVVHSPTWKSNRAFINLRNGGKDSEIQDFVFENICADNDIASIVGAGTVGTFKNITIKNMTIRGRQRFDSYLKGGHICGIRFENLTIDGKCVQDSKQIGLQTENAAPVEWRCGDQKR